MQLMSYARDHRIDFELIGLTLNRIHSNCGAQVLVDHLIDDLKITPEMLVIPPCDATSILLTDPRIHQLIRRTESNVLAAPQIVATLARVGLLNITVWGEHRLLFREFIAGQSVHHTPMSYPNK